MATLTINIAICSNQAKMIAQVIIGQIPDVILNSKHDTLKEEISSWIQYRNLCDKNDRPMSRVFFGRNKRVRVSANNGNGNIKLTFSRRAMV